MGLESPEPRRRIPYSVSIPQTFWMATDRPYPSARLSTTDPTGTRQGGWHSRASASSPSPPCTRGRLEVLTGAHPLDGAATGGLLALREDRAHVDDALALLPRDLRPVVGVGGVGQVLVLLVLLPDRLEQVGASDAPAVAGDVALDGQLLGPADDVLDHGAGGEVLE